MAGSRKDATLLPPKEYASEHLLSNMESDMGSWSGLDETGPDKVGIGLFFRNTESTGMFSVSSIVPGSSSHLSGLVVVGDRLMAIDNENVVGLPVVKLRAKIQGVPGTFITLDMQRQLENGETKTYRINCMRGSPAFIAYQDKYGVANASRLDELVLQKREEQKFNSLVEKQLRIEQTKFAEAQRKRKDKESLEKGVREELERCQRELYLEEASLMKAVQEEENLITSWEQGGDDGVERAGGLFNTIAMEEGRSPEERQLGDPGGIPNFSIDAPLKLWEDHIYTPLASLFSVKNES